MVNRYQVVKCLDAIKNIDLFINLVLNYFIDLYNNTRDNQTYNLKLLWPERTGRRVPKIVRIRGFIYRRDFNR